MSRMHLNALSHEEVNKIHDRRGKNKNKTSDITSLTCSFKNLKTTISKMSESNKSNESKICSF